MQELLLLDDTTDVREIQHLQGANFIGVQGRL